MEYKLQDLIDIPLFQRLQDKLNEIYPFPFALLDHEGNILTTTAWQDTCMKFHRNNPCSESECKKSDLYINDHLKEADPALIYKCPNGLMEVAIPIIVDGEHLGTFFLGQFLLDKPDIDHFKKQAKQYNYDETQYLEAVSKINIFSEEQIKKYIDFIKTFAEIITETGLYNKQLIEERNISEKKNEALRKMELILRKSEKRFKQIVENASDFIWETDQQGLLIYCSEKIKDILGYTAEEVIRKKYLFDLVDTKVWDERKSKTISVAEKKDPFRNHLCRFIHRNGQPVMIEINGSPFYDPEGTFLGYSGMGSDVTRLIQTENSLREQERIFSTVATSIKDGIIMMNDKGAITFWNDATTSILGYTKEEVLGKNLHELFASQEIMKQYGKGLPLFQDLSHGAIKGQTAELPILHKDQRNIIIELSVSAIKINNQRHAVGIIRDITERKQIQNEINGLVKFLNEYPHPVIRIKENGEILYGNNAASQIFHLWHCASNDFAPDYWIDEVQKAISTQQVKRIEFDLDDQIFSVTVVPINEEGYVNLYATDITAIKKAEKSIRDSEERYRTIYKTIPDTIIITKLDGTIVDVNNSFIKTSGFSKEEAIGSTIYKMNFFHSLKERDMIIEALQDNRSIENFEIPLRMRNGLIRNGLLSASLMTINNETLILSIIRNITSLKEMEKELIRSKEQAEEASKLKSSLLRNLSHEIRTPLNGILGFAEILGETFEAGEQKQMAEVISQSGKRLMSTLNSIMELAQIESNRTWLEFKVIDLGMVTSKIVEKYRPLFDMKKLELIESYEKQVISNLDKHFFDTIVSHLIDNALKYTKSGSVTVRVFKDPSSTGRDAILQVQDTGIGISQEQMEYIFDAFRQGDEGFNRSFEGTGLGLTLCKRFTEIMGGEIEIDSKFEYGTTLTIRFPYSADITLVQEEPVFKETKIGSFPENIRPNVLIVEDNKPNADLMTIFLREFCITDQASDGIQAIKMTQKKDYDVILMDINLGHGQGGINAAKEIRKIRSYQQIPIIAVTGYTTLEDKKYFLTQGFNDFISKPFERDHLISVVRRAMKKH